MDIQNFMKKKVKDIAQFCSTDTLAVVSPQRHVPHVLYWENGPKQGTLEERLNMNGFSKNWILMTHPVRDPRILVAMIDGEYVPPRNLRYEQVFDPYAGRFDRAMVDSYNSFESTVLHIFM